MVLDHEGEHSPRWTPCQSIASQIGCSTHTLLDWVKKAGVDSGKRAGVPADLADKLKDRPVLTKLSTSPLSSSHLAVSALEPAIGFGKDALSNPKGK